MAVIAASLFSSRAPEDLISLPYKTPLIKRQNNAETVLFIGDEHLQDISKYLKYIEKKLKRQEPEASVGIISYTGLGMHRVISILESLDPFPAMVIYYGNQQELFEKKFSLDDIVVLRKNLGRFQQSLTRKLLFVFPWLKLFVYQSYHSPIALKENIEIAPQSLAVSETVHYLATAYQLYEFELKLLYNMIKQKGSQLVLLTTPLDLQSPQVKNCIDSMPPKLEETLKKLTEMTENGEIEKAYGLSKGIMLKYNGIAELYYLHGKISELLNKREEALDAFKKSKIYSCQLYAGNPVFNQIVRNFAMEQSIPFFDFSGYLEEKYLNNKKTLVKGHPTKKNLITLIQSLNIIIDNVLYKN